MSEKKRFLFVTQEMDPYLVETEIAKIARELPQHMLESGMEIRVLMPRFGNINERRHRLHEVVRLSGINIIIDDDDYPLVIKVASLPGVRLQVYFLDNEDFFKRKKVFHDENDKFFDDNVERMIFFCKGVVETVRKFGWPPDLIHCHGWMTSLIPFYLKTAYKNDPIFQDTKIVYSIYGNSFKEDLKEKFYKKAPINSITEEEMSCFKNADNTGLIMGATQHSDAIIVGSEEIDSSVDGLLKELDQPVLEFTNNENYLEEYSKFYQSIIES